MNLTWKGPLLASAAIVGVLAAPAAAQTKGGPDGSWLFRTYCSSCHGTAAKGDGPLADSMRRRPPDLTEIAKRAGGPYPSDEVYRIIDGREPVRGHGGPDMPVWGDAFTRSAEGNSPEAVKEKIMAIVKYLEAMQMKLAQ